MKKIVPILILIGVTAVIYFLCLFIFFWLTCQSYKYFDNVQTRMTLPFCCNVSDGEHLKVIGCNLLNIGK